MTENNSPPTVQIPPEDFIDLVKQVLEHLYDFSYLQQHPLAGEIGQDSNTESAPPAQALRREVLRAIDTLNPGGAISFHSPVARLYNLLNLRYVESMTIPEAAQEMALSVRQAHRDLRRGEENVASILWARRRAHEAPPGDPPPNEPQVSSVQSELSLLKITFRTIDFGLLIRSASQAVEQLASLHTVSLHVDYPPDPIFISTDPSVAQQILIAIFSFAIQEAAEQAVQVTVQHRDKDILIHLHYIPRNDRSTPISTPILNLIDRLGWQLDQQHRPNIHDLSLHITTDIHTLLLIDDNEGLTKLFARYLTGYACQVVSAHSGREGLHLARKLHPQVIVLDVMIPEMNGWELLQRLLVDPDTANIPIIVCSVFNDPNLAYSLGASDFISKPLEREQLLAALRKLAFIH